MALQTLSQRTGRRDICLTQGKGGLSMGEGLACTHIAEQLSQQPWGCTLAHLLGWPASSSQKASLIYREVGVDKTQVTSNSGLIILLTRQ